jgi:hypothetical protein
LKRAEVRISNLKRLASAISVDEHPDALLLILITYLFVKLDKGWLEEFIDLLASVVGVLSVTQTFALKRLVCQEVLFKLSWESMKWHNHVLSVSDLLELDV